MSQRLKPMAEKAAPSTNNQTTEETKNRSKQEQNTCPECDGNTITDRGELLCEDCGLVLDDQNIDHGPEWRAFSEEERQQNARTGAPTTELLHDKGLTTDIDWRGKDGKGQRLTAAKRKKMQRLRKWHNRHRAKNPKERSLRHAIGEIKRMSAALGIPEGVQEIASRTYQQSLQADMIQGHSIEGMATASLYAACRMQDIPRSLSEVAQVSRIEESRISRDFRHLSNGLPIEIQPPKPLSFIPKIASDIGASREVQQKAESLLSKMVEMGEHSGKHPTGLAAGAIYAANVLLGKPENHTQDELADAAKVTEVTIRSHYKTLIQYDDE